MRVEIRVVADAYVSAFKDFFERTLHKNILAVSNLWLRRNASSTKAACPHVDPRWKAVASRHVYTMRDDRFATLPATILEHDLVLSAHRQQGKPPASTQVGLLILVQAYRTELLPKRAMSTVINTQRHYEPGHCTVLEFFKDRTFIGTKGHSPDSLDANGRTFGQSFYQPVWSVMIDVTVPYLPVSAEV
nr:hypothetical protein [Pseudomonas guryensis]